MEKELVSSYSEEIYSNLTKDVMKCCKCDLGCSELDGHNPHVMGQGSGSSGVMFVAEAPGMQETIYKQPLTSAGTSGKIYEKLLQRLELTRDEVYTTNTVLCRPPKNRDPEPWEVHKCGSFLKKQINLVKPNIIVTFGRFAAQVMLGSFKITKEHGELRYSEKYNVDIFPLYHPAYIGAYGSKEKREEFKKDVNKLKQILDKKKE